MPLPSLGEQLDALRAEAARVNARPSYAPRHRMTDTCGVPCECAVPIAEGYHLAIGRDSGDED